MRVITGRLRGRRIPVPKGGVRPTPERVREALFSILYSRKVGGEGSFWLDLFCGTGAVGIEALSRGAAYAAFVDSSRKNLLMIEEFLKRTGMREKAHTIVANLPRDIQRIHLHGVRPYDLIFADPPFSWGHSPLELLENPSFLKLTHSETLLVWECPFRTPEFTLSFWTQEDERRYGQILLRFFLRK